MRNWGAFPNILCTQVSSEYESFKLNSFIMEFRCFKVSSCGNTYNLLFYQFLLHLQNYLKYMSIFLCNVYKWFVANADLHLDAGTGCKHDEKRGITKTSKKASSFDDVQTCSEGATSFLSGKMGKVSKNHGTNGSWFLFLSLWRCNILSGHRRSCYISPLCWWCAGRKC